MKKIRIYWSCANFSVGKHEKEDQMVLKIQLKVACNAVSPAHYLNWTPGITRDAINIQLLSDVTDLFTVKFISTFAL